MSELATVRAEIKAWERTFKVENGRAPTVDDIKQNPAVADKYKLYKRLSKAPARPNSKPSESPSTPPRKTRPKPTPSLLLSQPRAVQPAAPLETFNPFSPQKKQTGKGKEKAASHSNPFASPKRPRKQSHSPDPFPAIQRSPSSSSTSSTGFSLNQPPAPTSAVSRARKRLRGDPVSPSPNKDKRRRVTSQTLTFPRVHLDASGSDKEWEDVQTSISFVDESPIKAPTSGRLFPQLFEESSLSVNLFGTRDQECDIEVPKTLKKRPQKPVKIANLPQPPSHSATETKKELSDRGSSFKKQQPFINDVAKSGESSNWTAMKRPYPDGDIDQSIRISSSEEKSILIPPSPPPPVDGQSYRHSSKAQGKTVFNRKKIKVNERNTAEDSSDLEPLESQPKLRVLDHRARRRQHASAKPGEDDVTSDSDPILAYSRFAAPHAPSVICGPEEGSVEIDLPDELRRVLALQSAESKKQVSEEDRLVKGLLLGRRMTHYDPQKGGEIWDVGEGQHEDGSEGNVFTESEEDWEGEPVPWEIGEL